MAQEIGVAYVSVVPSGRGFGKAVEGEVGQGLDGATKRADKGLMGLAKRTAKWGTAAVLAVGATITGLAVKGGIDRALNIEDAQAKLKGLGHDTRNVEAIMTDALNAVRGTAFGLDSAATVAASAVAAGVKPGQELERYLRLTADAATIAGISMDEMGGIMNKVTANGRAMTENLYQLQDRGIPIMQWLADEYQVSAEELRKMVSQGKVDAETFNRVIEENIGGAALASGDTTRGAFANMGAALSRLGVTLTSSFLPHMKDVFGELTVIIDGINERIGPFAEKFAGWFTDTIGPALDGMGERFLAFLDGLTSGESGMSGMLAVLSPLGAVLQGLAPVLGTVGETLREIGGVVGQALVQVLEALMPLLPVVADAFGRVVEALAPLVKALIPVVEALLPPFVALIETLAPIVGEVAGILADVLVKAFKALAPAIRFLAPIIGQLAELVGEVLGVVLEAVAPLLTVVADLFKQLVPVISTLMPPIMSVVRALMPLVQVVGDLVARLLPPIIDLFVALLEPILALIGPLVDALAPVLELVAGLIGDILVPVIEWLADVLGTVVEALIPVIEVILTGLIAVIEWLIEWVGKAASAIGDWVMSAVDWVKRMWSQYKERIDLIRAIISKLIEKAFEVRDAIIDWVKSAIDRAKEFADAWRERVEQVIDFVKSIPDQIRAVFSNAKQWLVDAGKKILDGLNDGLRSGFDKVKNTLGELTGWLPDWKGPAEVDRRILFGAGQMVMDGFDAGLESRFGQVQASLRGFTSDLSVSAATSADALGSGPIDLSDRTLARLTNAVLLGAEKKIEQLLGEVQQSVRMGEA